LDKKCVTPAAKYPMKIPSPAFGEGILSAVQEKIQDLPVMAGVIAVAKIIIG
jgi:hypothetical protein